MIQAVLKLNVFCITETLRTGPDDHVLACNAETLDILTLPGWISYGSGECVRYNSVLCYQQLKHGIVETARRQGEDA